MRDMKTPVQAGKPNGQNEENEHNGQSNHVRWEFGVPYNSTQQGYVITCPKPPLNGHICDPTPKFATREWVRGLSSQSVEM